MKFFSFDSFCKILLLFLLCGEGYLFFDSYNINRSIRFSKISVNTSSDIHKLMVKESLRKYRYVFEKEYIVSKDYVNKYPNRIWVFWNSGFEKAPEIVKVCLNSIKKHSTGRIVETLDEDNLNQYLKLPDYILKKYKNGKISHQHFSDIVRSVLLRDYGGVWIDATTYLSSDIPQYIFDAEFFAPICYEFDPKQYSEFRGHSIIDNHFFSVKFPNNRFFQCMSNFLFEYWKNMDRAPYLIWYCFCSISMEEDPKISNIFYNLLSNSGEKLSRNFWALNHVLKRNFNENKWNDIKKFPIHKLSSRGLNFKSVKSGTFLDKLLKSELF